MRVKCPGCQKKGIVTINPKEVRTADFKIECDECQGTWYLQFIAKKK